MSSQTRTLRTPTRTPGVLYLVSQGFPSLAWRVTPLDAAQGRAMREREEPHVYDTSTQAYAVCARLEHKRTGVTTTAPTEAQPRSSIDPSNRGLVAVAWMREELLPALRGANLVDERTLRKALQKLITRGEEIIACR